MIKKITLGLATFSLAASILVTPAFAATAYNSGVSGGSIAKAKAIEIKKTKIDVRNTNTNLTNVVVSVSNTGGVSQSGNEDGNAVTTGKAVVNSISTIEVNRTVVK